MLATMPDMDSLARSTGHFGRWFLPDNFTRLFDTGHDQLDAVLDDESKRKVSIAIPRGTGKSTHVRAFLARKTCLWQPVTHNVTIVSETAAAAKEMSENIKFAFENSSRIAGTFGVPDRSDEYSKESWVLRFKYADQTVSRFATKFRPLGVGQQIIGGQYHSHRPDIIILDDSEGDMITMESAEHRRKCRRYVFGVMFGSMDYGDISKPEFAEMRVINICTIGHEECLHNLFATLPGWTTLTLALADDSNGPDLMTTLWPNFISTERVRQLWQEYKAAGEEDAFYTQYMNEPRAPGGRRFDRRWFRYYHESETTLDDDSSLLGFVMVDLARSAEEGESESAIVGVSVCPYSGRWFVREIQHGNWTYEEHYERIFDTCERIRARFLVPEITGLKAWFYDPATRTGPLADAMVSRGLSMEILPMDPRTRKAKRIGVLRGPYSQSLVWHRPGEACGELERQLLAWPGGQLVDVADALAHLVPALAMAGLTLPYQAHNVSPLRNREAERATAQPTGLHARPGVDLRRERALWDMAI